MRGKKVVVVDDTCTTGRSLLHAVDAVEAEGGEVVGVLCILDRNDGGGEKLRERGYELAALLEADEDGGIRSVTGELGELRKASDREREFHQAMVGIYETAAELGYRAAYFLQMVTEHGGLGAARRLLSASEAQSGLARLWELGRLDISMEALVVQDRWRQLFSDDERHTARERLEAHGYDPGQGARPR